MWADDNSIHEFFFILLFITSSFTKFHIWLKFIYFFIQKVKSKIRSIKKLTFRLPTNSKNLTIPSRFCVVDVADADSPFVSVLDIFELNTLVCFVCEWLLSFAFNSLLNWNNEKYRRLVLVNLKIFNMFQLFGIVFFISLFVCTQNTVLPRTKYFCLTFTVYCKYSALCFFDFWLNYLQLLREHFMPVLICLNGLFVLRGQQTPISPW